MQHGLHAQTKLPGRMCLAILCVGTTEGCKLASPARVGCNATQSQPARCSCRASAVRLSLIQLLGSAFCFLRWWGVGKGRIASLPCATAISCLLPAVCSVCSMQHGNWGTGDTRRPSTTIGLVACLAKHKLPLHAQPGQKACHSKAKPPPLLSGERGATCGHYRYFKRRF